MAVVEITHLLYVGLAGDTKPTTGVVKGARFKETDTGAEFMYTGAAWVEISPLARAEA